VIAPLRVPVLNASTVPVLVAFVRQRAAAACLIALLILASSVRLSGLSDTFVSFHSTRQYHCALIARAFYYEITLPTNEPRRLVAERARAQQGRLEPPITESLVTFGYWLTRGEHIAIARVLGASFWIVGGGLLYSLAAQLFTPVAALWAAAYYLFLPFGIIASQSFQPEALMMMLMIGSWRALLAYYTRPSRQAFWTAAAIAGLALLAKPVTGFSIAAVVLSWMWRGRSLSETLKRRDTWLLPLLLLLPSILYYLPDILQGGRLSGQADLSFQPEFLKTRDFWLNWRKLLLRVNYGYLPLVAAGLGVCFARRGRARRTLLALWLSYLAYGATFTYHISSHDYYQLPCIPIIALSLAALAERLRWLSRDRPAHRIQSALGELMRVALTAANVWLAFATLEAIESDAYPRTHRDTTERADTRYQDIGRNVQHSLHAVFLTSDSYGGPLMFYGEIAGWYWPTQRDIHNAAKRGKPPFDPAKRLVDLRAQGAEFFVSSPPSELPKQRKLYKLLSQAYPLRTQTADYMIFDLRQPR
jgi:hypothetical protein